MYQIIIKLSNTKAHILDESLLITYTACIYVDNQHTEN